MERLASLWKKGDTFRSITFFPLLAERSKFSVPFDWIIGTRIPLNRKRKICWYLICFTEMIKLKPIPVFGAKKIPIPFDLKF